MLDNTVYDYIIQHKCENPTYIISLCGESDQFPMWNATISSMYAKSIKRIIIVYIMYSAK